MEAEPLHIFLCIMIHEAYEAWHVRITTPCYTPNAWPRTHNPKGHTRRSKETWVVLNLEWTGSRLSHSQRLGKQHEYFSKHFLTGKTTNIFCDICILCLPGVYSVYAPGRHRIAPSDVPDHSGRSDQTVTYIEQAICAETSGTFYWMLIIMNDNFWMLIVMNGNWRPTNMSSQVANETRAH